MFENILWAKAVEPVVAEVDKISTAAVEEVLKNLDRLATLGMWAIGIILGIALFVVGYNVWVSERTIRKLRKEFEKTIAATKREFENKFSILECLAASESDKLRAFQYMKDGNNIMVAFFLTRTLSYLVEAKEREEGDRLDEYIINTVDMIIYHLDLCRRLVQICSPKDIQQIRKNISQFPKMLSPKRIEAEQILDKIEKNAKKKGEKPKS